MVTMKDALAHKGQVPAKPAPTKPNAKPAVPQKSELERLREENARLQQQLASKPARNVTMKVSGKGAMSLYGMGRFPITLYKEQWIKVLDMNDEIRQFLEEHDSELSVKE